MSAKRVGRWSAGWGFSLLLGGVGLSAADGDLRLLEAAKARDTASVRALLEPAGLDVNTPQGDGATALHWAVHWNDAELASLLIRAGANVNAANDLGVTPLALACTKGSATVVEALLQAGANPSAAQASGKTALMTAVLAGHTAVVKLLLAHGADIDAKELSKGQTALMWAIAQGHRDIVQLLIQSGADVRARSQAGSTPLLFAARMGDMDSARRLLAAGVDVNDEAVPNKKDEGRLGVRRNRAAGANALLVATVRGHLELAKFLLDHGADPNADLAGYSATHWAAGSWWPSYSAPENFIAPRDPAEVRAIRGLQGRAKLEMMKALLAHGGNPNARLVKPPYNTTDDSPGTALGLDSVQRARLTGATPFALAAAAGDTTIMRVLLAAGADPQLRTTEATTPLMLAAGLNRDLNVKLVPESRALDAAKLLLELGADVNAVVNAVNDAGNTALHGAAHLRYERLIQFLVEKGARLNVKNKDSQTPLTIAERRLQIFGNPVTNERSSAGDLLRKLGAQ